MPEKKLTTAQAHHAAQTGAIDLPKEMTVIHNVGLRCEGMMAMDTNQPLSREEALRRVAQALDTLKFGEITIKVEKGKPIWVDVHERYRVG